MKKKINLLVNQKKYLKLEGFLNKFKIISIFIFFIFLIINFFIFYLSFQQQKKINSLSSEKKSLLEFFMQNKDVEAKFIYFGNKNKQLKEILKEDVYFVPYYNLLKESLTAEANLDSVIIDKSKSVDFSLSFNNNEALFNFLRVAESDDFLKNFKQMTLVNFNSDSSKEETGKFRLSFSGKFIDLNTTGQDL